MLGVVQQPQACPERRSHSLRWETHFGESGLDACAKRIVSIVSARPNEVVPHDPGSPSTDEPSGRLAGAPAEHVRRRLLLIDDSELTLVAGARVLTEAGFDVRAVSSLQAFVNVLMDWRPQLIVTDLDMPEMQGDNVCRWLRSHEATARIPIVICSAETPERLAEIARRVAADGFVSKREGLHALPALLEQLCDEILW